MRFLDLCLENICWGYHCRW